MRWLGSLLIFDIHGPEGHHAGSTLGRVVCLPFGMTDDYTGGSWLLQLSSSHHGSCFSPTDLTCLATRNNRSDRSLFDHPAFAILSHTLFKHAHTKLPRQPLFRFNKQGIRIRCSPPPFPHRLASRHIATENATTPCHTAAYEREGCAILLRIPLPAVSALFLSPSKMANRLFHTWPGSWLASTAFQMPVLR